MNEKSFKIDAVEVFNSDTGSRQSFSVSDILPDEEEFKFISPVKINGYLEKIDNGLRVEGKIESNIELICSRCANNFQEGVKVDFERIIAEDASDEEIPLSKDLTVDLQPIAREEIILSMPIKSLCKENCQGIKE